MPQNCLGTLYLVTVTFQSNTPMQWKVICHRHQMPWILTAWLQCNHFCKNRNTVVMSLEMSNACVANPNKIRASYQYITDIYWWGNCAQERHAEEQRLGGTHSGRLGITLLLFCDFFKERSKQKRFFWFIILSTPQLFILFSYFVDITGLCCLLQCSLDFSEKCENHPCILQSP